MDDTMCDGKEEGNEQPEQNNNPLLIEEAILDVRSQLEVNNSELEKQKFSLKIIIPGNKEIYKSTLVSLLNNNPEGKLSKDRLTRVASTFVSRQNNRDAPVVSTEINYRKELSLNCDVAILQKSKDISYLLGRVQRMIKGGETTRNN